MKLGKLIKDDTTADSIYLPPLISTLIEYNYIIGESNIKTILHDLISKLDIFSSVRFLSPIGQITELNNDVISGFKSSILSTDFTKENIRDIDNCFTEKQDYMTTPQILPQNVVLNGDLRYPLSINSNIDNKKFYTLEYIPSAYYNVAYMKNNRTPHYNINYKVNDEDIPVYDYEISDTFSIDYILSGDKNTEYNKLFDIDITHSIDANTNITTTNKFNSLNKHNTITLLDYAVSADIQLASENPNTYANMYPRRMITKTNDYLEPYKNYHVANNKLYNIGQLNGIRNYIHVGTLQDSDKLWFSYKYKTTSDQHFIDSFNETYSLEFEPIELNREKNHWIYDVYGRPIVNWKMKNKQQVCPWSNKSEKQKLVDKTTIQELLSCNCGLNETCSGFCTFPANNHLDIPSGIIWNDGVKSQFHIISSNIINNVDRELFVEEDITVNDDVEIYFISGNNKDDLTTIIDEINEADKSIDSISGVFKSLFQGFGNYIQNPNEPIPQYLAINNTDRDQKINGYVVASHCPFNTAHTIPAGTKLCGFNWNTKELMDYLPANYIALFRVRSWWSDIAQCTGKIKAKIKTDTVNIDNILNVVSNYDYVERNFGFFKYQQENMHKSNVYSVKITNSGLNPENNLKVTYIYNKADLIKLLLDNVKINLYKELILVNDSHDEYPLYDLYYDANNDTFYSLLMDPNLLLSSDDIIPVLSTLPTPIVTGKIYHIENENISAYYRGIYHNNNIEAFPILYYDNSSIYNYKDFPTNPLPSIINGISLEDVAEAAHIAIVKDNKDNFSYAYDILEKERITIINKIRNEMRTLLENAIRTSVVKYMPVETTMWKIIYNGK